MLKKYEMISLQEVYNITVDELKDLMDINEFDVRNKIARYGGINGISKILRTSLTDGISGSTGDIKVRKYTFGCNVMPAKASKSFFALAWEAMKDTILTILEICAVISIVFAFVPFGESQLDVHNNKETSHGWIEGIAILLSCTVVVLVTAANDYSKEKQFRALQQKLQKEHLVSVIRKGETQLIQVTELVVGDIYNVKYGDLVSADGILLQSNDIKVDESSLTGESDLIKKDVSMKPLLWGGTHIMEGSGKILVTAVGINSQCGITLSLMGVTEESSSSEDSSDSDSDDAEYGRRGRSVLQAKLNKLAIQIGYIGTIMACLTIVVLVIEYVILHYVTGKKTWHMSHCKNFLRFFIIGITVLVVAVPEGLPLAVTLSLAYSVRKMMNDNNLVRHLSACETMGNATTICSDKTGTLTTNRMTVVQSYICGKYENVVPTFADLPNNIGNLLLYSIAINTSYTSNIELSDDDKLPKQIGNKTECALLGFLQAMGKDYKSIRKEIPEESFTRVYMFNSERKYMSTVVPKKGGGYRLFIKGASEIILNKCTFIYDESGKVKALTIDMKANLTRDVIEGMAHDGLRTLCIAHRDFAVGEALENEVSIGKILNWDNEDNVVDKLTCIAIVGIEDPVRPEVPAAIESCMKAGIVVRMLTGDNINTARSIALKCGIIKPGDEYLILEGQEFNKRICDPNGEIQQVLLDQVWPKLRVLARSSPRDKYNLVNGIINSKISTEGEIVAVTGDGTNDGPALQRADVGFAMGVSGTDVAKEASDIIITDDNFSSIVKSVMWGRNVYDCISKFLQFQLTVNICAVVVAFTGALAVQTSPLTAVQLLWVNLIMDTLASLALATESPTPELLNRKPYGRNKTLISVTMLRNIIGHCLYEISVIFALLFKGDDVLGITTGYKVNHPTQHFTIVFNTFVMMTLFNEINARKIRSERNVFKGIFTNPIFYIVWSISLFLQAIIVEFGGVAFFTSSITWIQWLVCIFFAVGALLWNQLVVTIPTEKMPPRRPGEEVTIQKDIHGKNILRLRSVSRLRTQTEVLDDFISRKRSPSLRKTSLNRTK